MSRIVGAYSQAKAKATWVQVEVDWLAYVRCLKRGGTRNREGKVSYCYCYIGWPCGLGQVRRPPIWVGLIH